MAAIVTMLNQKGGVGKTSVTLGLASAAMAAGRRVLVVDLDPQASSTWVLVDPDLEGGRGAPAVDRVLTGGGASAAARAVTTSAWGDGVDLLPSRPELARWEHASGRDATRLRTLAGVVGRRAIWKPMVPQRVIASQAIAERRPIHSYGWRATDLIAAYDALWATLRRRCRQVTH